MPKYAILLYMLNVVVLGSAGKDLGKEGIEIAGPGLNYIINVRKDTDFIIKNVIGLSRIVLTLILQLNKLL